MDSILDLIKSGDKGLFLISDFCYQSKPCQHFCKYEASNGKSYELGFLHQDEIATVLKTGTNAINYIVNASPNEKYEVKTLEQLKEHFY
jgi:hypothetical protein